MPEETRITNSVVMLTEEAVSDLDKAVQKLRNEVVTIVGESQVSWLMISGKPEQFPAAPHNHSTSEVLGLDAVLKKKADLSLDGRVLVSQMPDAVLTQNFIVGSEGAMLEVAAQSGDFATRTDQNNAVYILKDSQGKLDNWIQLKSAAGTQVTSVNGLFGDVSLTPATLKAAPESHLLDKNNPHAVTKTQVGLGNLTNDAQIPLSQKGQPNGVATLDANGFIPEEMLPASVAGMVAKQGTAENSLPHLEPGQEATLLLSIPANDLTVRVVQALGMQQAEGSRLSVRFYESGPTAQPGAWIYRSYEAIFGFHGGGFYTSDEMPFPYLDQDNLKKVRVVIKNLGSTTITNAGVSIRFIYKG